MRRPCIRSVSSKCQTDLNRLIDPKSSLTVFLCVGADGVLLVVGGEAVHGGLDGVDVGGLADLVAEEAPEGALLLAVGVVHAVGQLVVGAVLRQQLREQDVALEAVDGVEGVALVRERRYLHLWQSMYRHLFRIVSNFPLSSL